MKTPRLTKTTTASADPPASIGKLIQESRRSRQLTQEQLARSSGVPYTTLTKVESGAIRNPSAQVVNRLAQALGLSVDSLLHPRTFIGGSSVEQIFSDVLATLSPGDSMCISGINEQTYLAETKEGVVRFVAELGRRGISQRLLSCEGDLNFLPGEHIQYRWIPEKHFYPVPIYVYGSKIAVLVWGPPQQAMIIENEFLAEAYRRQFLLLWEHARPVPARLRKGLPRPKAGKKKSGRPRSGTDG